MELSLKGRSAIVTGGSKGIGKAIAKSLANEDVNVVICARGIESLKATEEEIIRSGGNAVAVSADTTYPDAVNKVVSTAIEKFGKLDILVNNVGGVEKFSDFFELTDEDWLASFKLNIMSTIYFVRYSVPWLKKSECPRIINISSISGVQPGYYNPHYTITKASLINLSKYLSNYLLREKILVNVVCPGPVHSDSWYKNIQNIANLHGLSIEEARIKIETGEAAKIPIGRVGEPEDVSELVTFLVSDKASWITGSCFHINGGKLNSIF